MDSGRAWHPIYALPVVHIYHSSDRGFFTWISHQVVSLASAPTAWPIYRTARKAGVSWSSRFAERVARNTSPMSLVQTYAWGEGWNAKICALGGASSTRREEERLVRWQRPQK